MIVAAPAPPFATHSMLHRAAWLVPLGLASYGLRLSSWLALPWAGRRFDPHGFGLLGDTVLLLVLAPVLLLLLGWVRRGHRRHGVLAPAATPDGSVLSVLLLVLLAAPLPGQVWALVLLPLSLSWPVLVSVLLWSGVVAIGRALAVAGPRAVPAVPAARS